MEPKNNKIQKIIKFVKSTDFVYVSVIFLFIVIVIVLFLYSTNFIVKNINKIFSSANNTNNSGLNMENYLLAVKKLNLPTNIPENNTSSSLPPIETASTPNPQIETATPETTPPKEEQPAPPPVLDKKSITIEILNSTSKKGVAATLAKKLEDAGFAKATTGNEKTSYNVTTIKIAESKKDYLPSLEETIKSSYSGAVSEIVPDKTGSDVTIIIGKE